MTAQRQPQAPGEDARYDTDIVVWANEQARLLRAGRLDQIDIAHIAAVTPAAPICRGPAPGSRRKSSPMTGFRPQHLDAALISPWSTMT
jgi:hypothetical protein